ncbi:MAG: FecR domain-containing protein [bacterium]|nr:FecR domain-containing protein [bacterium]
MKYFVGIIVLLFAIGGLVLGISRNSTGANVAHAETIEEIATTPEPWIDIESGEVRAFDAVSGEELAVLESGDTVSPGLRIVTGTQARATIQYPDGSEARMEPDTDITIEEATYDPKTETLVVRFSAHTGKVWSKIIELVTPESRWEVTTSQTVATVRGTAFGIEVDDGGTNVIGSENTVAVIPIDPKTGQRDNTAAIVLSESDIIKASVLREQTTIIRAVLKDEIAEHTWTTVHVDRDVVINKVRTELIEKGVPVGEVREVLKERVQEIRKERLIELRPQVDNLRNHLDPRQKEGLRKQLEASIGDAVKRDTDQKASIPEELRKKLENHPDLLEQVRNEIEKHGKVSVELEARIKELLAPAIKEDVVRERVENTTEVLREEAVQFSLEVFRKEIRQRIYDQIGDRLTPEIKEFIESRLQTITPDSVLDIQGEIQRFIEEREVSIKQKAPQVVGLLLERTKINNERTEEGDRIEMRAILELADDSRRDVTKEAVFEVLGPIGTFVSPGVFEARLDESVREFGKSSGSIVVSWTDPVTKAVQFANSPIFEVHFKFDQPIDERG